jgi:hypothetical protein
LEIFGVPSHIFNGVADRNHPIQFVVANFCGKSNGTSEMKVLNFPDDAPVARIQMVGGHG